MSVQSLKQRTDTKARSGGPRVDYHCHISMTEYSDIENPTLVSVTVEEFLADLDEAVIDVAVVRARTPIGVNVACKNGSNVNY